MGRLYTRPARILQPVILPGFRHRPGAHCGSTALCDALRVRGLDLSEPLAFGLGAGLGFHYVVVPELTPSRFFQGRAVGLERTACEVLGAPAVERSAETAEEALAGVRAALGRGFAPILSTELSRLPYWRSRTPFGGHRVVLAGLDEERGIAWLADTGHPDLQEVPLARLDEARATLAPPFALPGRPWLEVDAPTLARPVAELVRDALRRQAADMLLDTGGLAGVQALERFADDLGEWPARARDERDRARCFRFAYQVIEVRGTGGGNFRRLYAGFLAEVEPEVPGLAALGLAARAEAIAAGWTRLAEALRALGEADAGEVPADVRAQARALATDERRLFEDVAAWAG